MGMRGLTWKTLKETPSLIPLFLILGLGISGAILYPIRCALKSPDVTWSRLKNPEPWNEYTNKHYKFIQTERSPTIKENMIPKY